MCGHLLKEVAMPSATTCTALISACSKVDDVVTWYSSAQTASNRKLASCCVDLKGADSSQGGRSGG